MEVVVQTIIVFKCLVSGKYEKLFLTASHQHFIICFLALERFKQVIDSSARCFSCNAGIIILRLGMKIIGNISLNNYTKRRAEGVTKSKSLRKLSTLIK